MVLFVSFPVSCLAATAAIVSADQETNLETESPIYNQILQQEQIELHKLSQLGQCFQGLYCFKSLQISAPRILPPKSNSVIMHCEINT
jgi:hypothetical protein